MDCHGRSVFLLAILIPEMLGRGTSKTRHRGHCLDAHPFGPALQPLQELPSPRGRHGPVEAAERVLIAPALIFPGPGPEQFHDAGQQLETPLPHRKVPTPAGKGHVT